MDNMNEIRGVRIEVRVTEQGDAGRGGKGDSTHQLRRLCPEYPFNFKLTERRNRVYHCWWRPVGMQAQVLAPWEAKRLWMRELGHRCMLQCLAECTYVSAAPSLCERSPWVRPPCPC